MLSPSQYRPVEEVDPEDADDERSISELEDEALQRRQSYMGSRRFANAPQFPGQDVRPTSQKELAGWYSYAWASEVYVVCGIGKWEDGLGCKFELARVANRNRELCACHIGTVGERKRRPPQRPCHQMHGRHAVAAEWKSVCYQVVWVVGEYCQLCNVGTLGNGDMGYTLTSRLRYTFSISVLIQSLIIISMSGAADHGKSLRAMIGIPHVYQHFRKL